jgi:hypothetical protein
VTGDRRAPWWYSGDDDEPLPDSVDAAADPHDESGADDEAGADDEEGAASSTMDWTALVAGAARMVDWATERVIAPHAEHADPAEHPDCMVCRTVVLIGDPVGLMAGGQRGAPDDEDAVQDAVQDAGVPLTSAAEEGGAQPIRWIPIVESRD